MLHADNFDCVVDRLTLIRRSPARRCFLGGGFDGHRSSSSEGNLVAAVWGVLSAELPLPSGSQHTLVV